MREGRKTSDKPAVNNRAWWKSVISVQSKTDKSLGVTCLTALTP